MYQPLDSEVEINGELDDTYMYSEAKEDQSQIELSITYFKIFDVTNECLMYESGMKHFSDYQPQHGYGYVKTCGDLKSIPPHNKMTLMNNEVFIKIILTLSIINGVYIK